MGGLDDLAGSVATFSSNGSIEPSIITEVNPHWIARSICS